MHFLTVEDTIFTSVTLLWSIMILLVVVCSCKKQHGVAMFGINDGIFTATEDEVKYVCLTVNSFDNKGQWYINVDWSCAACSLKNVFFRLF